MTAMDRMKKYLENRVSVSEARHEEHRLIATEVRVITFQHCLTMLNIYLDIENKDNEPNKNV